MKIRNAMVVILLSMVVAPAVALAANADAEGATFNREVVRILQDNCQSCHRPGDIAPMSLLTYREARPWAKSIRRVVSERTMPPWHADSTPGQFLNDTSLTDEEIATLVDWVNRGAPEGDPSHLPPPRTFDHEGWKAGDPDLVYEMVDSYTLPAGVDDEYRCFVIPTHLEEDAWYRGLEFRPGNPEVVHHVIAFADTTDASLQRDRETPEPGFLCGMASGGLGLKMLGGWAPGNAPIFRDGNAANKIDGGSYIVYQVHYHNTTGEDQPDRSSMAVYLMDKPVRKTPRVRPVAAWRLDIPAGNPNVEHRASWTVPEDITIPAIMPHMHYLGKDMTVTAEYPDGRVETLLSVPRYDFNWQTTYQFTDPVQLPGGTVLKMVSHHDNSAENPANPVSPPQDVHFGEATDEEMAIAWVAYTLDSEALDIEPTPREQLVMAVKEKKQAAVGQ